MQEIRAALCGLSGARARAEANSLAARYEVSVSRVYDVTRDLRPKRKPRADKGKRRADILEHDGLRFATELRALKHVDPDLAIETAVANGYEIPVSLGTYQRYLREHGLNRQQLRNGCRPHRRWEAANPLDIFQFDISGVKERWIDVATRRILHVTPLTVSKNHPNKNSNLVPLWKFGLVDDHSRLRYVRFVACDKPNSINVIDFLLPAFRELGIPLVFYTDNDAIIVSKRMRRAASILDRAFASSGGFRLEQHAAGNPQATGKVEVGHQIFEKFEKLIGVKYETPSLEALNEFTVAVCERYNWTSHRETGAQPMLRFRSGHGSMRIPPDVLLDDAFKADEFEVSIRADLTISFKGESYQLPRSPRIAGLPNPFLSLAGRRGMKITIVWPPNADYFVAVHDGIEYELDRVLAKADSAGEYKSVAETRSQQAMKALKESAAARKQAHKEAGTDIIVPGIDVPFAASAQAPDSIAMMPRKRIETNPELLAALGAGVVPPSMVDGQLLDFWSAASLLAEEGLFERTEAGQVAAVDMEWLKSVYNGRDEVLDTELRVALGQRVQVSNGRVIAMRSA
jgi:hypothetical protein